MHLTPSPVSDEPAAPRPAHRPLGRHRRRAVRAAVGLPDPTPARRGRSEPDRPCPVLSGHEDIGPPALESYGPGGQWPVRVVTNRYPAFGGTEPMVVTHLGPVFTQAPASGVHEVFVLTPDHTVELGRPLRQPTPPLVMEALRDRMAEHTLHPGPALQPGRGQQRARGRGLARAPPRPAAVHAVRPGRDRQRAGRLRPLPGQLPAVRGGRRRGGGRAPAGLRRRPGRRSSARSGAAPPTRCWSFPRHHGPHLYRADSQRPGRASVEPIQRAPRRPAEPGSATWPTTSCSTPPRTG